MCYPEYFFIYNMCFEIVIVFGTFGMLIEILKIKFPLISNIAWVAIKGFIKLNFTLCSRIFTLCLRFHNTPEVVTVNLSWLIKFISLLFQILFYKVPMQTSKFSFSFFIFCKEFARLSRSTMTKPPSSALFQVVVAFRTITVRVRLQKCSEAPLSDRFGCSFLNWRHYNIVMVINVIFGNNRSKSGTQYTFWTSLSL